jgi:hypothetical protein
MADKTIVEQLSAANAAVAELTGKLTAAQTEAAAKVTSLEASVAALTGERETFKAQAEKAGVDLNAANDQLAAITGQANELTEKVKGLEARLADPSFKAAGGTGEKPVDAGGNVEAGAAIADMQAAYDKEKDPVKKSILGAKLVAKLEGK